MPETALQQTTNAGLFQNNHSTKVMYIGKYIVSPSQLNVLGEITILLNFNWGVRLFAFILTDHDLREGGHRSIDIQSASL